MSALAKVRLVGWLHIVVGVAGFVGGLAILMMLALSPDKDSRAGDTLIPLVLLLWMWVFAPGFVGGIGLLWGQRWAHFLLILLSFVELLLVPVGTVIGALGLWILLGRSFDEAMPAPVVAAPAVGGDSGTTGVLVAMAGVGAGFVIAIGAGYMISGDRAPDEISALFYPAIGVFVLVIVYAVRAIAREAARRRAERAIPLRVRIDDHTS